MCENANKQLGTTADGFKVYDRPNSHFHSKEISPETLADAISKISTNGWRFRKGEAKFDETVGYTSCVEVDEHDDVDMYYRIKRWGKTPMVKGRSPEPCKSIVAILKKDNEDEHYLLITAYVGTLANSYREPWDRNIRSDEERAECEAFWSNHALIYDPEQIDWERMA